MSDVINRAVAGNSQVAVIGNGVAADIGQLVAIQVKGNICTCGDGDILRGLSRQLDGNFGTISQITQRAHVGEGAAGDGNLTFGRNRLRMIVILNSVAICTGQFAAFNLYSNVSIIISAFDINSITSLSKRTGAIGSTSVVMIGDNLITDTNDFGVALDD